LAERLFPLGQLRGPRIQLALTRHDVFLHASMTNLKRFLLPQQARRQRLKFPSLCRERLFGDVQLSFDVLLNCLREVSEIMRRNSLLRNGFRMLQRETLPCHFLAFGFQLLLLLRERFALAVE